jgi:hypothetical protein
MVREEGDTYRFVIKDRAGVRPSIHGYGHSLAEAHEKIDQILSALDELEQQQRAA